MNWTPWPRSRPSTSAASRTGRRTGDGGTIRPETLRTLDKAFPGQAAEAIDGGVARCKVLDRLFLDQWEAKNGPVGPRPGLNFLEADWVATSERLYYVSPGPRFTWALAWDDIVDVVITKQGWPAVDVDRPRRWSAGQRVGSG